MYSGVRGRVLTSLLWCQGSTEEYTGEAVVTGIEMMFSFETRPTAPSSRPIPCTITF
jgi:hypothetical protein